MANHFLVQIHDFISTHMTMSRQALEAAQSRNDNSQRKYCQGRLEELHKLRTFLSDQFDLDTQTYY